MFDLLQWEGETGEEQKKAASWTCRRRFGLETSGHCQQTPSGCLPAALNIKCLPFVVKAWIAKKNPLVFLRMFLTKEKSLGFQKLEDFGFEMGKNKIRKKKSLFFNYRPNTVKEKPKQPVVFLDNLVRCGTNTSMKVQQCSGIEGTVLDSGLVSADPTS